MTGNYGDIKEHLFNKIDKILIIFSVLFGSLLLFFPVHYVLLFILAVFVLIYMILKPEHCYYLVIFTIPFSDRLRFLPISFSINDILIFICSISVFLNILFESKKVNLKTSCDRWNLLLLVLYFVAGIASINATGILTSFKFLESLLAFYITIYMIRTQKTGLSKIIKVFLFTALFQATLGILQSITGEFGAINQFPRGYLGYLGIGPTMVWQAVGTMGGTGLLSEFLTAIILLILPFLKVMNKKRKNIIMEILLIAVYMGYTKLSIFSLLVCGLAYYGYTSKKKTEAILKITAISIVSVIIAIILAHTSFILTVDETMLGREYIWSFPIYVLMHNPVYLWFGSGLNSYWDLIDPLLPANIVAKDHFYMLAHNYFLLTIQEMGIIGTTILFSFFVFMGKKFLDNFKKYKGYYKNFNMFAFLFVITIFTSSCFGQFYYATYTKILIYIFFGIVLSKENLLKSKSNVKKACDV